MTGRGTASHLLGPVLLPVVLTAGLAGCASTSSSPDPTEAEPDRLTVLAAASLTDVFAELGTAFEHAHPGVEVTFSFGASSELATQVAEGAPADVLATASLTTMEPVATAGLAAGFPVVFATNVLEIAVPADNPGSVDELADLADPDLVVALCAPQVPCGAAAERLLELAGVMVEPDTLEEDVRAALTKVELGEVDAALVYRTDVLAAGPSVAGIEIPAAGDVLNEYPIAALAEAGNPELAAAFVAYVRSPAAAAALEAAGFGPPRSS